MAREDRRPEWTVSRCLRLLRPITSRQITARSTTTSVTRTNDKEESSLGNRPSRPKFGDSPNPRRDPDWMTKPKKLASRQYMKRLPRDSASDRSAGEFCISTPMVVKFRGEGEPTPASNNGVVGAPMGQDILANKFLSQSDEVNYRSQKLIQRTLDLVEVTNSCPRVGDEEAFFPKIGARSLRAMCCKTYARHIKVLERDQQTQTADEKFDVTTEAYTLLEETFGTFASGYLRAVVREHGLALLEAMIEKSTIPREHVVSLIRRMRNPRRPSAVHRSEAEISSLAASILRSKTPDRPCCGRNNTYPFIFNTLADISYHCDEDSRTGFEFRHLSGLITSSIPICWLGSRRLTALWMSAFRVFVDSPHRMHRKVTSIRDASQFLHTMLALDSSIIEPPAAAIDLLNSSVIPDYHNRGDSNGCPRCPKMSSHAAFLNSPTSKHTHTATNHPASRKRLSRALENSVTSLAAVLSSFVLTTTSGENHLAHVSWTSIINLLGNLSMDIMLHIDSITTENGRSGYFARATSILAATLLITVTCRELLSIERLEINVNDLVRGLESLQRAASRAYENSDSTLENIPDLVFSTVRSAGKLASNDGFSTLSQLVSAFTSESLQDIATDSTRLFLAEVAISSAQTYAKRRDSQAAAELVARLEKQVYGRGRYTDSDTMFSSTGRRDRAREGWKWEDGICEWIAVSPEEAKNLRRMRRIQVKAVDVRCGTGTAPLPCENESSKIEETDLDEDCLQSSPAALCMDQGLSSLLLSPSFIASSSPISIHVDSEAVPTLKGSAEALRKRVSDLEATRGGISKSKSSRVVACLPKHKSRSVSLKRSYVESTNSGEEDGSVSNEDNDKDEDELSSAFFPPPPKRQARAQRRIARSPAICSSSSEDEISFSFDANISHQQQSHVHACEKQRKTRGLTLLSRHVQLPRKERRVDSCLSFSSSWRAKVESDEIELSSDGF